MAKVFFIMQHGLTLDQRTEAEKLGEVVELSKEQKTLLDVPTDPDLPRDWFDNRVYEIFAILGTPKDGDVVHAMGQPQLVNAINAFVRRNYSNVRIIESVTERKSVEIQKEDGTVEKKAVFEFKGFRLVYEF